MSRRTTLRRITFRLCAQATAPGFINVTIAGSDRVPVRIKDFQLWSTGANFPRKRARRRSRIILSLFLLHRTSRVSFSALSVFSFFSHLFALRYLSSSSSVFLPSFFLLVFLKKFISECDPSSPYGSNEYTEDRTYDGLWVCS